MPNHSISNKMISANSLNQLSGENNMHEAPRRRRTPSKYAQSIRQLTKMNSKMYKRDKNSEENQDEISPNNPTKLDKNNVLTCILPNGNRKLKLSIIIKKNPPKPKLKKAISSISTTQKQKQKQKQKNTTSLLDTLLQVVEQYKADQQNKKEQLSPKANQLASAQLEGSKRQSKPRKEKEEQEKYLRLFEKFRTLNEKFELMQNQIVLI